MRPKGQVKGDDMGSCPDDGNGRAATHATRQPQLAAKVESGWAGGVQGAGQYHEAKRWCRMGWDRMQAGRTARHTSVGREQSSGVVGCGDLIGAKGVCFGEAGGRGLAAGAPLSTLQVSPAAAHVAFCCHSCGPLHDPGAYRGK